MNIRFKKVKISPLFGALIILASHIIGAPSARVYAADFQFCETNPILYTGCGISCPTTPNSGTAPNGTLADGQPTEGTFSTTPGINKHLFIIVHTTEGDTAAAAEEALLSQGFSYHTLIEKNGTEIRLVPDDLNAVGAGGANTNSLQVSLVGKVGPDGGSHFDPQSPQLQTLSKRIAQWANKYNIPIEKVAFSGQDSTHGVIGHIDVHTGASGGHTDPGPNFPWQRVLANAKAADTTNTSGSDSTALSDSTGTGSTADSSSATSSGSSSSSCCTTAGSGAPSSVTGDGGGCGEKKGDSQANKDQIWSFFNKKFTEAGYTPAQAEIATAGIMGNWERESGFNPDRHNAPNPGSGCSGASGPVTGTVGLGIAQWCGTRQQDLKNFAGGNDISCLGVQLEFAWKEMGDRNLVKGLQSATDAQGAAHMFNLGNGKTVQGFEVGADDDKRQNFAADEYQKYTGKAPGSVGPAGASSSNCGNQSAGNGDVAKTGEQMGNAGGCYDPAGGHDSLDDLKERIAHNFGPGYGVDCTGFVRAVLYQATGKDPGSIPTSVLVDDNSEARKHFQKIPKAQAQAGDVAVTADHAEVITAVNPDGSFKTVGSHTTGCSTDKPDRHGIYPSDFAGNNDYVLRYTP